MNSAKSCAAALLLAALLCGCVSTWQGFKPTAESPAKVYRERAVNAEKRVELQQALLAWRIVSELEKDDGEVAGKIKSLEGRIDKAADDHFRQGLAHFQSGEYDRARRDFLIALRINPGHKSALYYVKTRLRNEDLATYEVKAGDSFIRIATQMYEDPSKAYVIAYFNGLNPDKTLLIGTILLLPDLGQGTPRHAAVKKPAPPNPGNSNLLEEAQTAYDEKQYAVTIDLTGKFLRQNPEHPKALKLADDARFQQGTNMMQHGQYRQAVDLFTQVNPNYKGRNQALAKARTQSTLKANDEKLTAAQEQLRSSQWESVIRLTTEILAVDPSNTQARMLLSNASYNLSKMMLDRGKVAQAVELLSHIDPSYEDTEQLLELARARMKSQAETHYREGVKHFINEDLELAVKEWKRALELNPQHPKARQDIEKARRLLQKLKGLEGDSGK